MSALYRGICYPSVEAARQQACSGASSIWGDAGNVITVDCVSTSFAAPTMQLCKRVNGGQCETIIQDYPPFPDCEFSGGVDIALEWMYLVLPIIATLWGIKKLIGLFDTNREDA